MEPSRRKPDACQPARPRRGGALFVGLLLLLTGCPRPGLDENRETDEPPMSGVSIRLAVVDDPAIAVAAGLLRGEWSAQTGADFHVVAMTAEQLTQAETLPTDAVICPSSELGTLAQRKLAAAMPNQLMQGDDWPGVFELLKLREAAWGPDIVGVSFGSAVLTCYYRADLLEKLGRAPPQTWREYQELAKLLADRTILAAGTAGESDAQPGAAPPWCGSIEPLAPGWAGLVLLARAAPYAKHRDNYSTLFSIDTMEPLVAGPPFVRALEELVAAASFGPNNPLGYDPASARKAFWQGHCGMALTWPSAAAEVSPDSSIRMGIAQLPGSAEVYNVGSRAWDDRAEDDDPRVPLLGVAGRVGVVAADCEQKQAAFELLLWLSGKRLSPHVCAWSPATTLFRRSHLESPEVWVEKSMPGSVAVQYAAQTAATFSRQQWLLVPRIPGHTEYLAALDDAVRQAVGGERTPAEALNQAAARWRDITQRLGMGTQKRAYRHSLGLL